MTLRAWSYVRGGALRIGVVAAAGVLGLCPGASALARQPAPIKAQLRFRIPAVGHYALVRATVPFVLGPGVRFPRGIVKLSADTRMLPNGIVVVGHAYFAHVGRRPGRGKLVLDAVLLHPIARAAAAQDHVPRARAAADGIVGLFVEMAQGHDPFRAPRTFVVPVLEIEDASSGCLAAGQDVQEVAGDLNPNGYTLAAGDTVIPVEPAKSKSQLIGDAIHSLCGAHAEALAGFMALNALFGSIFDDELLAPEIATSPPPPKIPRGNVACREATDFRVNPPPSDGTAFQGPQPFPFPDSKSGATVVQQWLVDPETGQPPPAEPWTGVSWTVSYAGPLRPGDTPGWEYVLELDGRGINAQLLTPAFLTWRYGFTFLLPRHQACPEYATEP